jgi:acetyl esterase/lipase
VNPSTQPNPAKSHLTRTLKRRWSLLLWTTDGDVKVAQPRLALTCGRDRNSEAGYRLSAASVLEAVPFQLTTDGGAEAARQRFRDLPRREVHPEVRSEDRTIVGPAGPIPIRVYWPPTDGSALPVVVFIHGGGWSVGDLDTYDVEARGHAVGAGAVVVSVDYRLAPEHRS